VRTGLSSGFEKLKYSTLNFYPKSILTKKPENAWAQQSQQLWQ
jgi:hypothetical protein